MSLHDVYWAYLIVHSYGQWSDSSGTSRAMTLATAASSFENLELPNQVLFLWPLFLARPTADSSHAAVIRHDKARQVYEVVAQADYSVGDEVLFWDPRLTDASALCFRGRWLTARHRTWLRLNVPFARDPRSTVLLQKYGCAGQPLGLFVTSQRRVDPFFMACMRMLAVAQNASTLLRAEQVGWMQNWPETAPFDQKNEVSAAELAVNALEQALDRIEASNAEIRQKFGGDTIPARATLRVREAETMVIVGLLKTMKELALLSSHEYLFEAMVLTGKQFTS